MNTITFPKTQLSAMLQALRSLDDCPKQNYDIQDFSQEDPVDKTKLAGFAPQISRQTFILACKECGTLYRVVVEYAVNAESEDYEVICCEPY